MDEIDNLSIKSFSTLNSIDSELNQNEAIDKELNNKKSTDNKTINKELNNNDNQINLNDNQINLNDNQQSKTKSIDNLLSEDKWIFKFDWDFREELIKLLGEYTKLLITNKEISIDKKELIENNRNGLIKLLNKPPSKLDEESNSYEICISLDNNFKNQLINNLIKNENLIYYKDKIDTNLKSKLIEENNCIINKIINLPVEYSNNDVNLVDDEQLESNQSKSKDETLVNKLETELSNLKEEISKLKSKLDYSNSIKLYLVKKDMKKFFENDNDFYSEEITYLNIKWSIWIESKYDDDEKKKYLEFYLYAENEIDDKNGVKWKCSTTYELILKNNLPNKQDKVLQFNYTFDESTCYGNREFISEKELFNLDNGFIKDDTIKLEVNLKVDNIERNI